LYNYESSVFAIVVKVTRGTGTIVQVEPLITMYWYVDLYVTLGVIENLIDFCEIILL